MGRAVLEAVPGVAEIRLSLPNRHHFAMGSDDVFHVDDRPYGLIEGTVRREGAPPGPPLDW
jgi:urate oxidase